MCFRRSYRRGAWGFSVLQFWLYFGSCFFGFCASQLKYRKYPLGVHASINNWDLKNVSVLTVSHADFGFDRIFFRFSVLNDFFLRFYGF